MTAPNRGPGESEVARRGERPIAAAFNVLKDGALWGRYWGCEEEVPFLHFEVCYYQPIEDCIRRGVGLFSPGAGGEHKYHRAFEPEPQHSAHLVRDERLAALAAFKKAQRGYAG